MLIVIEQVLGKDEVRVFRERLEAAEWRDGAATAGTLARSVKSNQQLDDGAEPARSLGEHILRKLGGRVDVTNRAEGGAQVRMTVPLSSLAYKHGETA